MLNKLKYLVIILLIISFQSFGEKPPSSKATGFFLAFGVGPRIPVGNFSNSTNLGYGANIEFSYADSEILPVFLFATIGFEQYPGSQDFYQATNYSNFNTKALPLNLGLRYYFPPILENIVLLMPIVQASASYTYYEKLHEFDAGSGMNSYLEDNSKFGASIGAGISMFLMELLASYNYNPVDQFLSVDLKVRIPLYINL